MNKHSCKYGFLLTRFLIAGLLFAVCMCGASAAEWRLHPSSTERLSEFTGYDFPDMIFLSYAVPLRDKNAADRGSRRWCMMSLSSADMRLAAYSRRDTFVIVAYGDGTMDIVDADGRVTVIDDLEKSSAPGASVINSVTFDPKPVTRGLLRMPAMRLWMPLPTVCLSL